MASRVSDVLLWTLRKGEHEASAVMRHVESIGDELRFLWNGNLRVSRLFKIGEGAQLLEMSNDKARGARGERVGVKVADSVA